MGGGKVTNTETKGQSERLAAGDEKSEQSNTRGVLVPVLRAAAEVGEGEARGCPVCTCNLHSSPCRLAVRRALPPAFPYNGNTGGRGYGCAGGGS